MLELAVASGLLVFFLQVVDMGQHGLRVKEDRVASWVQANSGQEGNSVEIRSNYGRHRTEHRATRSEVGQQRVNTASQ